ncbi:P-loop containing nucleoside triphosphate hydrolase protein [Phaeosphaeriaceae sp. PMI808]|nr:P-loop containing nucleoside triphosphate hydrolase protein [Phaeosphaeriaceae sp. PMI808]
MATREPITTQPIIQAEQLDDIHDSAKQVLDGLPIETVSPAEGLKFDQECDGTNDIVSSSDSEAMDGGTLKGLDLNSDIPETQYETRVKYSVNYFKENEKGDANPKFVSRSTYDEPVEFEITSANEKLPALEETKDVLSPYSNVEEARGLSRSEKKATLGQLDRIGETVVRIHSPFLLNVLKSVIDYSAELPGNTAWEGPHAGRYFLPYKDLYYHLADLEEYKNEASALRQKHSEDFNKKCDEHIDLLKGYLESQPNILVAEARLQWRSKTPVTSFASFWLLLKPGIDAYVREPNGSLNAYVVHRVVGGIGMQNGARIPKPYTVTVWNLVFGGKRIYRQLRSIQVPIFDNEREISELPVYPARFLDEEDSGATKERLINRGKKYFSYSKGPCFLQYTGLGSRDGSKSYERARVVVEHASLPWYSAGIVSESSGSSPPPPPPPPMGMPPPPPPPPPPSSSSSPDSSGLIDVIPQYDAFTIQESLRVPRCECKECKPTFEPLEVYAKHKFTDYADINPKRVETLSEHQYLILSSHMYAFILKDRVYDLLNVDGLSEAEIAETAIDNLVMDKGNKDLIQAVARTYTDGDQYKRFSADFIQGKGEGQIILLHGPPGTGKTLTAESVAEYTKRPLLSITAADLGHEPDALERSLLKYFKRARDWDAIVLLDEADVYLEQRDPHDLKRNSIVSVFLRALDYFQGILFLTTNRVGHFDEAFMSRIHLSLGYEKLDDAARKTIWDNLFRKLTDDHEQRGAPEIRYEYDAKEYVKRKEVQSLEWNGREIRNAFQTSVALAVFDSKQKNNKGPPKITEKHLEQVVAMSSAFRNYMKATRDGMDDSTWAYKRGNREDKYPSTPAKQDA